MNSPNKSFKHHPVFEEFRQRSFLDVPIYRAKYMMTDNKPSEESRQNQSDEQGGNQSKHFAFRPSIDPSYVNPFMEKENLRSKYSPFAKPEQQESVGSFMAGNNYQSPQKRSRQFNPDSLQVPSTRAPFEPIFAETSQRHEEFSQAQRYPTDYTNRLTTNDSRNPERIYPIVRACALDYPFVIISSKNEPKRSPETKGSPNMEVYVDKKKKKPDEVDPFLQTLAKTFVVKDDLSSRNKSRALLKFEQAIALAEEEEEFKKSPNKRVSIRDRDRVNFDTPEQTPFNLSQMTQQESFLLTKKPSFFEERPSKDISVKILPEQTPRLDQSPESYKRKSALKASGNFANTEKKKDSVVRISLPGRDITPRRDAPRKSDAKQADFIKKLEDMQQRSQRRLTTLMNHSEILTPIQRKSVSMFDEENDS